MADPFVGEIRMFAGNFAPKNWSFCNGAKLSIAQNTALYSLLGTTYGGDGRTTFMLPNLVGSAPMQQGQGVGLSPRILGQAGGTPTVTLTQAQIPLHGHTLQASSRDGEDAQPGPGEVLAQSTDITIYGSAGGGAQMASQALSTAGQNGAHNNLQPYLAVSFIICLIGLYPIRP